MQSTQRWWWDRWWGWCYQYYYWFLQWLIVVSGCQSWIWIDLDYLTICISYKFYCNKTFHSLSSTFIAYIQICNNLMLNLNDLLKLTMRQWDDLVVLLHPSNSMGREKQKIYLFEVSRNLCESVRSSSGGAVFSRDLSLICQADACHALIFLSKQTLW